MINTENRFSGIPTIIREMADAGLKPPVFESAHGNFKVTLYNDRYKENYDCPEDSSVSFEERIGRFCKTPRSLEEIANHFAFDSQYYLSSRYLKPLIERGALGMTIPEKPKSKFQKYYSK